jgi:hypothetical protein
MTDDGDLVQWQGRLHKPDIHALYRTDFNAIDVNYKLALGPCSVCAASLNNLPLKMWLSKMAIYILGNCIPGPPEEA